MSGFPFFFRRGLTMLFAEVLKAPAGLRDFLSRHGRRLKADERRRLILGHFVRKMPVDGCGAKPASNLRFAASPGFRGVFSWTGWSRPSKSTPRMPRLSMSLSRFSAAVLSVVFLASCASVSVKDVARLDPNALRPGSRIKSSSHLSVSTPRKSASTGPGLPSRILNSISANS